MEQLESMSVTVDEKEHTLYRAEIMGSDMAMLFTAYERVIGEIKDLDIKRLTLRHAVMSIETGLQKRAVDIIKTRQKYETSDEN